MKKSVLYLFMMWSLLMVTVVSQAQLELKPAVGVNFTDFSKDPETGEASARLAWQLGGTVSFGDKLYGEAGIFWVKKSNEISENSTDDASRIKPGTKKLSVD